MPINTQLDEYFAGKRDSFDVAFDLIGTTFQKRVWQSLAKIPYGQTSSYREQALAFGSQSYTRAVASANARNPVSIVLPCHRIIGKDGSLTGFAGGLKNKRFLLQLEQNSRYN